MSEKLDEIIAISIIFFIVMFVCFIIDITICNFGFSKLIHIFGYKEKDKNKEKEREQEWIKYRNNESDYQEIIDDKLRQEDNFIVSEFYYRGFKGFYIKFCEKIDGYKLNPITSERLKQDKDLFVKFIGYYHLYFESAIDAMRKVKEQKIEEEKKKPVTPAEILADKEYKVEILNKDKTIAEAEEAIEKIKKRTFALFAKPKKEMTVGEKLREELRKEQEILQVGEEEKKGKSPEQQDRIDSFIYQQIEKIRKRG